MTLPGRPYSCNLVTGPIADGTTRTWNEVRRKPPPSASTGILLLAAGRSLKNGSAEAIDGLNGRPLLRHAAEQPSPREPLGDGRARL